jgi:hypothetical protein
MGGSGGVAGNGANGGNGGRIVVYTAETSILSQLEIICSAGEGGLPGVHGMSGTGGQGGFGGNPGNGGVYQEIRGYNAENVPIYVTKQARPGRAGKAGKRGKAGKNPSNKPAKRGEAGSAGAVSFIVLDNDGFKESGGTPFRICFPKEQLPLLVPYPVNYSKTIKMPKKLEAKASCASMRNPNSSGNNLSSPSYRDEQLEKFSFVFGEKLVVGPILPINSGALTAPSSLCVCVLTIPGIITVTQTLDFPDIPGEAGVHDGKLSSGFAKTLTMILPSMKDMMGPHGKDIRTEPWTTNWNCALTGTSTSTALRTGYLTLSFMVDGFHQRYYADDKGHKAALVFDVLIDLPATLVSRKPLVGVPPLPVEPVSHVPSSVMINAASQWSIAFDVQNKLTDQDLPEKNNNCEFSFVFAGEGFRPKVVSTSHKGQKTDVEFNSITLGDFDPHKANAKYLGSEYRLGAPAIPAGASATLSATINLNLKEDGTCVETGSKVEPGAYVHFHVESFYQGVCSQISPKQSVRMVPQWPPSTPPNELSLTFLTDATYSVADFQSMGKIASYLGLAAQFLDYEHFAMEQTGNKILPSTTWGAYLGKGVILSLSTPPVAMIMRQDLLHHLRQGGSVLTNAQTLYVNQDNAGQLSMMPLVPLPNDLAPQTTQAGRRVVATPITVSHASRILQGVPAPNPNVAFLEAYPSLTPLIMSILQAMPTPMKYAYLFMPQFENFRRMTVPYINPDSTPVPPGGAVPTVTLNEFARQATEAGCCGCGGGGGGGGNSTKIVPVRQTPMTIRDAILALIKYEITFDLECFAMSSMESNCFGLITWAHMVEMHLKSGSAQQLAPVAQQLYAVVGGSGFVERTFKTPAQQNIWKVAQMRYKVSLQRCFNLAMDAGLDPIGLAERIRPVTIVAGKVM